MTWLGLNLVTCYWYLSNLFLPHFSAFFWINWIFCYSILFVHLTITLFCYFSDSFGFYSIHHYVITIFLDVIYHFAYVLYYTLFMYLFILCFQLLKNFKLRKKSRAPFSVFFIAQFFFSFVCKSLTFLIVKLITNYFTFLISEKTLSSF